MKVIRLPADSKIEQKFEQIPGSVRSYICTTARYKVEAEFATANFYAPEFYHVNVKSKEGALIWSGGQRLFLDSFFGEEFISDHFNKLVLQQINDTQNPSSGQIILVDLATATERQLTGPGAYGSLGHFQSFDSIFYYAEKNLHCLDFETGKQFLLTPLLTKHFSSLKTWWVSPVKNCIVLVTNSAENNLVLFDIMEERIKQHTTLPLQPADNINLSFVYLPATSVLQITAGYATRDELGIFRPCKTEWFNIEFH